MRVSDYITEVKLSLLRLNVLRDLSDPEILTYVNTARHEVQRLSHRLYPEWYGRRLRYSAPDSFDVNSESQSIYGGLNVQVDVYTLPEDFIDAYHVEVRYTAIFNADNESVEAEARYMTKQEMYNVQSHAWNTPSMNRPAYTIVTNSTTRRKELHLALPNSVWTTGTVRVTVWYTAVLEYLDDNVALVGGDDREDTIPIWLDEMVVSYATGYALLQMKEMDLYKANMAELQSLKNLYISNYDIEKTKETVLLPSKEAT